MLKCPPLNSQSLLSLMLIQTMLIKRNTAIFFLINDWYLLIVNVLTQVSLQLNTLDFLKHN